MLLDLRLRDWKSFGRSAELRFGRVTFLVGPNGSGKSNLIDALKFLQGAALDLPFGDVLRGRYEGQREVWPGIRGGLAEAARHGASSFEIYSGWSGPVGYRVEVEVARDATLKCEGMSWRDQSLWGAVGNSMLPAGLTSPAGKEGVLLVEVGAERRSVLGRHRLAATQLDADNATPHARDATAAFVAQLRELIFLDVQPTRMRDYRPEGVVQLGVNAENVSPMLYQLQQRAPAQLHNVIDWLSELCAPAIEAIDFDQTQLGEVMMFLVERGGAKLSARSASDGTLRFLGLIVALLTVPEGSMIIVEEPDVGLHPSRIHLLTSLIEETAQRRSLQVIATTHSPTVLAHLSDAALADVLAFGRDPDDGTTIGRRVGDLEHFTTLRDSGDLEHLISTGWLERAL